MPAAELSAVDNDNDGFSTSPAAPQSILTSGKSKKARKKAKKVRDRFEDDDEIPYTQSATPSPPVQDSIANGHGKIINAADDTRAHELPRQQVKESEHTGLSERMTLGRQDSEHSANAWPTNDEQEPTSAVPLVHDVPELLGSARLMCDKPDFATNVRTRHDFTDDVAVFEDVSVSPARTSTEPKGWSPRVEELHQNKLTLENDDLLLSGRPSPKQAHTTPAQLPHRASGAPYRTTVTRPDLGSSPDEFLLPPSPKRHPDIGRRYSRPQQQTRKSSLFDAAPPHHSQARFLTAPEFGLDLHTPQESGSSKRCMRFDTFADAGDEAAAARANDVLLVGTHGALDVYRVLSNKLETIARLEGLRGSVLDAKVLPVVTPQDRFRRIRPLVAIVLYGPTDDNDSWIRYQTTVEVYSLKTQEHISTLYRGLPITTSQPVLGQQANVPEAVGNLHIDACGSYITLASGSSGEIWVFLHDQDEFYCIAKFWTALQRNPQADDAYKSQPLMSLSRRWLVIVCPDSSSNVSIGGSPAVSTSQAYGVASHNAPIQPPVTAVVDNMDKQGIISQLSRQAAQELLKASRKGIDMGISGWKEFTNPTPPTRHTRSESQEFPPTHAPPEDDRQDTRPAVISIVDLCRLPGPPNIATFALENGCNFLSLNTDGLRLVTTNRTGEASDIWDLSHSLYVTPGKSNLIGIEESQAPYIRLIQRISRNSESVVIDAAWSLDDRLALQTRHGTIHLHKITETDRRKSISAKSNATVSLSQGMSPPSGFLSSLTLGWQRMSTLKAPEIMTGLTDSANAARAASGRMLVRGLAQGYTLAKTGVSEAWHADDNKIRLLGAMRWVGEGFAVSAVDKVHLLPVVCQGDRIKVERGKKEFVLPATGAQTSSTSIRGFWVIRPVAIADKVALHNDEMETNPPYCPFHVDRKVALMVWSDTTEHNEDWCFGDPLPSRERINSDPVLPVGTVDENESLDEPERSVFKVDDA